MADPSSVLAACIEKMRWLAPGADPVADLDALLDPDGRARDEAKAVPGRLKQSLEDGYAKRDLWLAEFKEWPWLDALKPDPRVQAILRRMNFSP